MSIKYYDKETGKWVISSSNLAVGTRVIDAEGYYESDNVEGCLKEIGKDLTQLKEDVEYINENGTIGGGGGGGGSLPSVKLDVESNIVVSTDEILDVYYFFSSPNVGRGTAVLSINNVPTEVEIKQGKNKWSVGPFEKGKHRLDIYVVDIAGLYSNSVTINVTSGALELKSTFDDSMDLSISDDIEIDYSIISISPEDTFVRLTLDGQTEEVKGVIGNNIWKLGRLETVGVHKASIQAYNSSLESNVLNYNLVVSDTDHLFQSSSFDQEVFEIGKRITIDYRVSMKGEVKFYTDLYKNGALFATVTSKNGINYWDIGTETGIGDYTFKIVSRTLDGQFTSNELEFKVSVVSDDYVPFQPVKTNLYASFDANGKLNEALDRTTWKDDSGNNVSCTLHNFNFSTNGWLDNALKFNGKTYAEIDLKPLEDNARLGLTVEVFYKVENVGDIDGKVVYCKNMVTPYQGFMIDTSGAQLRSANGKIVTSEVREREYIKQTFVIDRENRFMYLYVNGVISKVAYIDPTESFLYDGKLILGAGYNEKGEIVNNSNCSIKSVRIYNSALDSDDILHNYIADIKDKDEQMALRELNYGQDMIPTMRITGDINGMSGDVEKVVNLLYMDPRNPNNRLEYTAAMSWQGTSSLKYPIKNYTIKLRNGGEDAYDTPREDWMPEKRFTLKANYMESSHSNNLGTAKFVHELFKQNPYPSQIKNPDCRSSVDGFPIRLILNNQDMGLYTFNLDRYAHVNLGLEGEPNAVSYEVAVNSSGGAAAFADDRWESIRSQFNYRYHYAGDEDFVTERVPGTTSQEDGARILKEGYHKELQELVSWVKNTTVEDFKSEFEEHFSKAHCIDYFLVVYVLGLVDSLGKNMVLTTWGRNTEGNTIWYPSFYDCDTMLGLTNDGQMVYPPSIDMSTGDYNTSESLLWTKMQAAFGVEIADRYKQLRLKEFTPEYLLQFYEEQMIDQIGQKQYNDDAKIKYLNKDLENWMQYIYLCNGNRLEATKRWLDERFIYMDSVYNYGNYMKPAILRSNVLGPVTLRLKSYSPMMVEVSFSDDNEDKIKKLVNKDSWTEFSCDLKNGKDNNISITGAPDLMYIDGIEDLFVSSLLLSDAERIVEVNCHGSKNLHQLLLGNNYLLQKVDCGNCINLGNKPEFKSVNLEKCINLKYLDCSNTQISEVIFNQTGGVLEHLDLSNTELTAISLNAQEYLPSINLEGCADLSDFSVSACNALTEINLSGSKINGFAAVDCDNITTLDISYSGYLSKLDLSGCPNLENLTMAGITNSKITELDLTSCPKIKTLDITGCIYLGLIKFANGCNTLKRFIAKSSAIKQFKYGRNEVAEYLDLSGFDLEYVTFENCGSVTDIRGINLNATGSMKPFYNCVNLVRIRGHVKLVGSISQAFRNCEKLAELPASLDLSGVTTTSEAWENCKALTRDMMITIFSKLTNVTDCYRTFANCTNIVVDNGSNPLPATLFNNATKISSLYWTFAGCTNMIHDLPIGIFDKLTNLTTFRMPFYRVTGTLPSTLFAKCPNLTDMWDGFNGSKIEGPIPETLFSKNLKLFRVSNLFGGNNTITSRIPEGLFAANTQLRNADNIFSGCSGLFGSIPENLFSNSKYITTLAGTFNGCTGLTGSIPPNLLNGLIQLTDASSLFKDCRGLTGSLSENFFATNQALQNIQSIFNGCTELGGLEGQTQEIPVNIFKGKRNLQNISYAFNNCNKLQFQLSPDMFKDLVSLRKISYLFGSCKGLTGTIPEKLFTCYDEEGLEVETIIDAAEGVFNDCSYLSGKIPEDLFSKFLKVTSLARFFYYCTRIEGGVPDRLFENCPNLVTVEHMFYRCYSLGRPSIEINEESPYCVDPLLLASCPKLESARGFLQECTSLRGELPEELFRTNIQLKDLNHAFYADPITGTLTNDMFRTNTKLTDVGGLFRGCTGLTAIEDQVFAKTRHPNIKNFGYTFNGCSNLVGTIDPKLWELYNEGVTYAECFKGATKITNYDQIPTQWK